jgi:hypothetical protein
MTDYYSNYLSLVNSEKNNYKGAGFIFYEKHDHNNINFLLALDNVKKSEVQALSTFGGTREKKDKNALYTAVRETFEELFNIVPNGMDLFLNQIQKKVDDYTIIEKMFVKNNNEVSYFAELNILNLFIEHLIYHESKWTFKNNHKWSEYHNHIHIFLNDRLLKNNQVVKNGLNEVKKVFLVNFKLINGSIKNNSPIIIDNKEYHLKESLKKYFKDEFILNIINKIIP